MQTANVIECFLVPLHEDGSETIHPTVGSFNNPSPGALSTVAPPLSLLASRTDVRDIAKHVFNHFPDRSGVVPLIHARDPLGFSQSFRYPLLEIVMSSTSWGK